MYMYTIHLILTHTYIRPRAARRGLPGTAAALYTIALLLLLLILLINDNCIYIYIYIYIYINI